MVIAFSYSLCITDVGDGTAVVMLRPSVIDTCVDADQERARLLEADFIRLAGLGSISLDLREVYELTSEGLRTLRMFKRTVDIHRGRLVLCNVREQLRPILGNYFYVKRDS